MRKILKFSEEWMQKNSHKIIIGKFGIGEIDGTGEKDIDKVKINLKWYIYKKYYLSKCVLTIYLSEKDLKGIKNLEDALKFLNKNYVVYGTPLSEVDYIENGQKEVL